MDDATRTIELMIPIAKLPKPFNPDTALYHVDCWLRDEAAARGWWRALCGMRYRVALLDNGLPVERIRHAFIWMAERIGAAAANGSAKGQTVSIEVPIIPETPAGGVAPRNIDVTLQWNDAARAWHRVQIGLMNRNAEFHEGETPRRVANRQDVCRWIGQEIDRQIAETADASRPDPDAGPTLLPG